MFCFCLIVSNRSPFLLFFSILLFVISYNFKWPIFEFVDYLATSSLQVIDMSIEVYVVCQSPKPLRI